MNYWIFKSNPEHYRIDDRLLDPDPKIVWAVTRYHEQIQKGDIVFIWKTGKHRGICGVMTVDDCPYKPEYNELLDGYEILTDVNSTTNSPYWAKCQLTQRFQVLEAKYYYQVPGLETLTKDLHAQVDQQTNYRITRSQGEALLEYIKEKSSRE